MKSPDAAADAPGQVSLRVDKWLWAARFYKTRSLAVQAIDAGHVRVFEERIKPARTIRAGDFISIRKAATVWNVTVTALSNRRGSATDALHLYAESPESIAARDEATLARRAALEAQPRFSGRPTKRQRRKLEDFLSEP